jgi:ribonuclease D
MKNRMNLKLLKMVMNLLNIKIDKSSKSSNRKEKFWELSSKIEGREQ